jgi:hypothetical protein
MTENKVTLESINAKVVDEAYQVHENGRTTFCTLTLVNGWTEYGVSACADAANFDADEGRKYARADAIRKLWPLEGYLLREKLHRNSNLPPWCPAAADPLIQSVKNGDVMVTDRNTAEVMLVLTARTGSGAHAGNFLKAVAQEMA